MRQKERVKKLAVFGNQTHRKAYSIYIKQVFIEARCCKHACVHTKSWLWVKQAVGDVKYVVLLLTRLLGTGNSIEEDANEPL